ncbi:MAG: GrpB family protein [Nocardioides sp.]
MPTPEEITRHHESAAPEGLSAWVEGMEPRPGVEPRMERRVEIVDPDPLWPGDFVLLADRIREALGSRTLGIEHVGSTSVPGLPAKPVIDIDLTVADSADEAAWLPRLEAVGFTLVIREPWWHEHRCLVADGPRCNLHVFSPDCPEVIRHRIFRDWLIENPEDRARYRDAKLAAAATANELAEHVMDYNARKEPIIREIYDRAFRAAGLL